MKRSEPAEVTVLMSVYNAEAYLDEAIRSILDQTFENFEFLIINDGSLDSTQRIIESFKDKRIRLINQSNRGLTYSLNKGIRLARTDLIARMDGDDVSMSQRLQEQVEFMSKHPGHVLLGTAHVIMDSDGKKISDELVPTLDSDIRRALFARNVFAHGSAVYRKEAVIRAGLYKDDEGSAEDYGLWTRLAHVGQVANLPELLFKWRINPDGVSLSDKNRQNRYANLVKDRYWKNGRPEQKSLLWGLHSSFTSEKYRDLQSEIQGRIGREYSLRGFRLTGLGQILLAILIRPIRLSNYVYLWASMLPQGLYFKLEKMIARLRGRRG